MAMRGNARKQIHASHSCSKLKITGHFHIQGPQLVGGEGGAPEWVSAAMEANPKIEAIAIVTEGGGVVFQRLALENAQMSQCGPEAAPVGNPAQT